MRFVICLLLCVACAHATITTTSTVELSRSPHYATELRIENVAKYSTVFVYIPINYQVQSSGIVVVPAATKCTWSTRHIFDEEVAEGHCFVDDALALLTMKFNGTAAFMPVRFPVKICPKFPPSEERCWTNEHIWGSPSPLEQLISCEIVAIAVLVFWISVGCVLCVCLRRNLPLFQYHNHERKCNHIVIAEESGLLDSDDDGPYVDKPEGAADGDEEA